jgi:hypothetical protein
MFNNSTPSYRLSGYAFSSFQVRNFVLPRTFLVPPGIKLRPSAYRFSLLKGSKMFQDVFSLRQVDTKFFRPKNRGNVEIVFH